MIDITMNDGCLFSLIVQKSLIQSQEKNAVSCPFFYYSDCWRRFQYHCEKMISILITLVSTCGKSSFQWLFNLGLYDTCRVHYFNTLIKLRGMWCGEDSWIKQRGASIFLKCHAGVYFLVVSYSANAVKLCECV